MGLVLFSFMQKKGKDGNGGLIKVPLIRAPIDIQFHVVGRLWEMLERT